MLTARHHLLALVRQTPFRRLMYTRLIGQLADGAFQASLAGAVLFNPESAAHASDIAAGFAVLLLPYYLLGPFAGVLLDRWSRRQILVVGNFVRAGATAGVAAEVAAGLHGQPLYISALVVISLTRFVLSALSSAQPHVVSTAEYPTANAFATTAGTVATALGGGIAILAQHFAGKNDISYAVIALAAGVVYALAAVPALRFAGAALGPDDVERAGRETPGDIVRGMGDGARAVYRQRPVFNALTAIGLVRLCHGVTTVCTVLLYRNYFQADGVFRTGVAGLAQVVLGAAVGGALAALITPAAVRRWGDGRWPVVLMVSSAVVQLTLILAYRVSFMPFAIMLTSIGSQGIKICVDTIVQREMADDYRGRVFAFYDTLFNLALVAASVLTVIALPENGRAPWAVAAVACVYLFTAGWYATASRRRRGPLTASAARTTPAAG